MRGRNCHCTLFSYINNSTITNSLKHVSIVLQVLDYNTVVVTLTLLRTSSSETFTTSRASPGDHRHRLHVVRVPGVREREAHPRAAGAACLHGVSAADRERPPDIKRTAARRPLHHPLDDPRGCQSLLRVPYPPCSQLSSRPPRAVRVLLILPVLKIRHKLGLMVQKFLRTKRAVPTLYSIFFLHLQRLVSIFSFRFLLLICSFSCRADACADTVLQRAPGVA